MVPRIMATVRLIDFLKFWVKAPLLRFSAKRSPDQVLFSGDIIFEGRVPFLGDSNTRRWVRILERMEKEQLVALVPGHGGLAEKPNEAISLTRRYLVYLREKMGEAVNEFVSFSDAYEEISWSNFDHLPAFEEANRRNAYQVYLSMEAEMLGEQ